MTVILFVTGLQSSFSSSLYIHYICMYNNLISSYMSKQKRVAPDITFTIINKFLNKNIKFMIFSVIFYCSQNWILRHLKSITEPPQKPGELVFVMGWKWNNLQFPVGILFFDSLSVICLWTPLLWHIAYNGAVVLWYITTPDIRWIWIKYGRKAGA